jgi:hypothetical protein
MVSSSTLAFLQSKDNLDDRDKRVQSYVRAIMQLFLRTASDVPTSSIAGKEQFTKSATQLIRPVEKVC